jgi:hypothetical protein
MSQLPPVNTTRDALTEISALRTAERASRLERAVRHKQLNPDMTFNAVGRLFRIGAESIRRAVKS